MYYMNGVRRSKQFDVQDVTFEILFPTDFAVNVALN
jgi:hypothetical protein